MLLAGAVLGGDNRGYGTPLRIDRAFQKRSAGDSYSAPYVDRSLFFIVVTAIAR
jgi:hypothetical protein